MTIMSMFLQVEMLRNRQIWLWRRGEVVTAFFQPADKQFFARYLSLALLNDLTVGTGKWMKILTVFGNHNILKLLLIPHFLSFKTPSPFVLYFSISYEYHLLRLAVFSLSSKDLSFLFTVLFVTSCSIICCIVFGFSCSPKFSTLLVFTC